MQHILYSLFSARMTKGTVQLTRAAVAVTTIYFITFSYVMIYYSFGTLDIWWGFTINSAVQQVGVICSVDISNDKKNLDQLRWSSRDLPGLQISMI